jgi:hypothetical protein
MQTQDKTRMAGWDSRISYARELINLQLTLPQTIWDKSEKLGKLEER